MKLADYLRTLPTDRRLEMADAAGTTYLHLRNVAFSGKSCGIQLAVDIEAVTGRAVCRWDLRPTDWHRIWPELVQADGAPALPVEPVNAV